MVAFHSLEDRIIKNFFKKNSGKKAPESNNTNNKFENYGFRLITKKPVTPSLYEVKVNPRSRSAKLRVAEKI